MSTLTSKRARSWVGGDDRFGEPVELGRRRGRQVDVHRHDLAVELGREPLDVESLHLDQDTLGRIAELPEPPLLARPEAARHLHLGRRHVGDVDRQRHERGHQGRGRCAYDEIATVDHFQMESVRHQFPFP